jgi:AcrR family transcriptional regulator
MVELVDERGYDGVTVRALSHTSGVSTRSFYAHFPSVEDCFASTCESLTRCTLRRAYAAQREADGGEGGVRAALRSLLTDIADHPREARLVLIEAHALGPAILARMARGTAALERILSGGFARGPDDDGAPSHIARGLAAGVTRVARTRLLAGPVAELPDLVTELGDWVMSLSGEEVLGLPARRRQDVLPQVGPERRGAGEDLIACIFGTAGDERARILAAVAKLSLTSGFSELTLSHIRAQAGVSRRGFHSQFTDPEEAFLEAVETIVASAAARAQAASSCKAGVPRTMQALSAEVGRNPALAQLVFVEILSAGRAGFDRRERLVSLAADQLRTAPPPHDRPSALAAEASVAAAWRIAQADVEAGRAAELPRLGPLLSCVLRGYTPRAQLRAHASAG